MIRLVSQFDAPRTRAQVASPKSSACSCCCCCCIASTLTASILTARAVGRVPARTEVAVPEAPPKPTSSKIGWKILGFFLLGLAVLVSMGVAQVAPRRQVFPVGLTLFVVNYIGGLLALRHFAGLHGGWILALVIGLPIVFAVEVAVWIGLILHK